MTSPTISSESKIFYHFKYAKGEITMKNAIVKAVVLCTLALSLLAGFASVSAVDTTNMVVFHDGPHDGMPSQ